jgi:guanylate kinase
MSGKMIIVSAPSGAGKSTLVRHLLSTGLPLEFSVSATSRSPRGEEKDGRDYYFLPADEFRKRIDNNEFVEWEEVYKDHYYGTLKSEIKRIWDNGNCPLFDVDVKGGINLKAIFGKDAVSVFIMPPSISELEERLRKRATDTDDKIRMRVNKAAEEIALADKFDVIIINDDLEKACREISEVVSGFIENR